MAETEAARLVAALAEARRRAAAGEVPALHGLARAVAELPAGAVTAGQLVALEDEIAGLLAAIGGARDEAGRRLAGLVAHGRARRAYGR